MRVLCDTFGGFRVFRDTIIIDTILLVLQSKLLSRSRYLDRNIYHDHDFWDVSVINDTDTFRPAMRIYITLELRIHIHARACIQVHVQMYTCICICMRARANTYARIYMRICARAREHVSNLLASETIAS